MAVYGLAILSACLFLGRFLGDILGSAVGVKANVGGVGIAMLILVVLVEYLLSKDMISDKAELGIKFWSAMYIPIVVAMAARQNVVAAIKGGPCAVLAGFLAVAIAFALVPILSKMGKSKNTEVEVSEN